MSNKKEFTVSLEQIQKAKEFLSTQLKPTPLLYSPWLSQSFDCQLYLKLENMTPIGSFKIRGAAFKISRLTPEQRKLGVVAASAGNHAQGVAWGARQMGTSAIIVMPEVAPLVKVENTRNLGAEVVLKGRTYQDAYQEALRIASETGRVYVHAFEDPDIIAGQGTIGLEILEQLPEVDVISMAMGGGGMASGISVAVKTLAPQVQLIAGQSVGASPLVQAIRNEGPVEITEPKTFADGTAVSKSSEPVRKLLSPRLDFVDEVAEDEIAQSVLSLMEKAKVVAEGSGAISLALLSHHREVIRAKNVVAVVSGGNIDVNLLARILDLGLIRAGRRLRLSVLISDRPGSLSTLTGLIAEHGASVIQVIHDRNDPTMAIDETGVSLTLETKGRDHSQQLVDLLKSRYRIQVTSDVG